MRDTTSTIAASTPDTEPSAGRCRPPRRSVWQEGSPRPARLPIRLPGPKRHQTRRHTAGRFSGRDASSVRLVAGLVGSKASRGNRGAHAGTSNRTLHILGAVVATRWQDRLEPSPYLGIERRILLGGDDKLRLRGRILLLSEHLPERVVRGSLRRRGVDVGLGRLVLRSRRVLATLPYIVVHQRRLRASTSRRGPFRRTTALVPLAVRAKRRPPCGRRPLSHDGRRSPVVPAAVSGRGEALGRPSDASTAARTASTRISSCHGGLRRARISSKRQLPRSPKLRTDAKEAELSQVLSHLAAGSSSVAWTFAISSTPTRCVAEAGRVSSASQARLGRRSGARSTCPPAS